MKNDELVLRLITSQSARMKLDEFVRVFRHRLTLSIYLVPVSLLVLANARALEGLTRWASMAVHILAVTIFVVMLTGIVTLLRRVFHRPVALHLHMTPPILVALGVAFSVADWLAHVLTGKPLDFPHETAAVFLLVWCVTEITFSFGTRFVLPRVLAEFRAGDAAAQGAQSGVVIQTAFGQGTPTSGTGPPDGPALAGPPLPETVQIGGRAIGLAELSHIVADGNFVHVHFGTLSLRLSARFAAVVSSVPVQAGMQIHRTVWVSAAKAGDASLRRSGRETVLRLADGTELPVAQSRRTEVAAWLRSLGARE